MAKKGALGFDLEENLYYQMSKINIEQYPIEYWDVNETITELSYLTHSYFRYYGKFPSKIGKLIVEDLDGRGLIHSKEDFVLDNYAGSGTTLVEAKLHGYDSFGIDINPFAVLACKVKTRNYDVDSLRRYWSTLSDEIIAYNHYFFNSEEQLLLFAETDAETIKAIQQDVVDFKSKNADAEKWFTPASITGISIIKSLLLKRIANEERDFFELAIFAIIGVFQLHLMAK